MSKITKAQMRQKLGNITQLQELLFGEQIEKYDRAMSKYERRLNQLESNQNELNSTIKASIERLENTLTHKLDAVVNTFEKRLKYLELDTKEEQTKIEQNLAHLSQYSYENIDILQDSINNKSSQLKTEISQSKAAIDRDLQMLKQQLSEKFNHSLEQLSTGKVSREDLAEVLFELCLKIKEPNSDLESKETNNNGYDNRADIMLPEHNGKADNM